MKRSFFFRLLAVGFVVFGCKSVGHRSSEVESLNGPRDRSDELHDAIVADLRKSNSKSENTIWFSSTMTMDPDWLIQSPDGYWGRDPQTLPKNLACEPTEKGCDPQFKRHLCSTNSDCASFNTTCQVLDASVAVPGQTPKKMCLGSGDQLLNRFYRAIVSGKKRVDITTLALPTGRFYEMLVNSLSYLSLQKSSPLVRILLSGKTSRTPNFLNPPKALVADLAERIVKVGGKPKNLLLDLGYIWWGLSWNHSKIVLVDGDRVISGGHNMYDPDYVKDEPVFDASLEFFGPGAEKVQNFVNSLWQHVDDGYWADLAGCKNDNSILGCNVLRVKSTGRLIDANLSAIAAGKSRMIGVGRKGHYGDNPSDTAFISLIGRAKKSIYIAQEDIFSSIPLPIVGKAQEWLGWDRSPSVKALVSAILDRNLFVRLVQTDQVDPNDPDGYGMVEAADARARVLNILVMEAKEKGISPPAGSTLAQYLCKKFDIAPWRFTKGAEFWGNGKTRMGSHPKVIIIDEAVFYMGSHNFYPANLQEFGIIVTDQKITNSFLDSYWNRLWSASEPDKLSCNLPDDELLNYRKK